MVGYVIYPLLFYVYTCINRIARVHAQKIYLRGPLFTLIWGRFL